MKEKMYKILCKKRKIEMCKEILQEKTKRRFDEEVNKIECRKVEKKRNKEDYNYKIKLHWKKV
jgi:hypothetical protein